MAHPTDNTGGMENLTQMTDFHVLRVLVPDIEKRIKLRKDVCEEIMFRSRKRGFKPFEWLVGCL